MPTILFLALLNFFLVASTQPALAQQAGKVFRVGYLSPNQPATDATRLGTIRQKLKELGYLEGHNLTIESKYAEGKRSRLPELAAALVRLNVDVIVAVGGAHATRAAMSATKTIPIVMGGQGVDPVEAGFVQSLAQPGGNVTGLTNLSREIGGKRLELFKEVVPILTRVAVIYEPGAAGYVSEVKEDLPAAARALKLNLQPLAVKSLVEIENSFGGMDKQLPDGVYVAGSPLMSNHRKQIAALALKSRLPSMFSSRATTEVGGLMSYGADRTAGYQRVAYYVDRILKGAKPADLPVEQPMKFEFVINLKTAKQIGLSIPPNVLVRADKVIR